MGLSYIFFSFRAKHGENLVLSILILSYLILSYLILSFARSAETIFILSYRIVSCLFLSFRAKRGENFYLILAELVLTHSSLLFVLFSFLCARSVENSFFLRSILVKKKFVYLKSGFPNA